MSRNTLEFIICFLLVWRQASLHTGRHLKRNTQTNKKASGQNIARSTPTRPNAAPMTVVKANLVSEGLEEVTANSFMATILKTRIAG